MHQLYTVKYIRASTLLMECEKEQQSGTIYEYTNTMASYDLLAIDDFGLMNLDLNKCRDLFEIIEVRDNRKATMVISQLPVFSWWEMFKDSTYEDACLSRITSKA